MDIHTLSGTAAPNTLSLGVHGLKPAEVATTLPYRKIFYAKKHF